jgi:hypothetical protein
MNKGSIAFKNTIKEYLENRGSTDPLFARIITKPGKNIDDCIIYIINTVQKSGCNGFTDDEIYSMAIHYFDEDNITVDSEMSSMKVVVNHMVELTEEDKAEAKVRVLKQFEDRETVKLQEAKLAAEKKVEKVHERAELKKKEKIEKEIAGNKTLF